MVVALKVVLAVLVYAVAFWGTWQVNRRLRVSSGPILWFVRIIVFVTIMYAISLPLTVIFKAL